MNTINSRIVKSAQGFDYRLIHRIVAYAFYNATEITPINVLWHSRRFTVFQTSIGNVTFIAHNCSRDVSIDAMLDDRERWWSNEDGRFNGFIIDDTLIGLRSWGVVTSTATFKEGNLLIGEIIVTRNAMETACDKLPTEIFEYFFKSMFPVSVSYNEKIIIVGSNSIACIVNRDAYTRKCGLAVDSTGLIYPAAAMSLNVSELLAEMINTDCVKKSPELSHEEIVQYLELKKTLKFK